MQGRAAMRLLVAFLLLTLAACSRPPEIIGIDPIVSGQSVPGIDRHRIMILSTRQLSDMEGAFFSGERSPELTLASVDVTIPPNHVVGQLERPKKLPPNPRTEFTVVNPVVYRSDAAFIAEINRALALRPPARRELLLFVHGYNNTASDAILRLAQFVLDSGFQGVPILFTWASAASTPRYVYDLNSALVARVKIKEMTDILSRTNATSVSVFAHSMGTLLTMEGLVDAQLAGRLDRGGRIDNIMLASPDIDIDLFRTQIGLLPKSVVDKMYLLVSKDDSALRVSRRIAGGVPRVGASDAAELEKLGVTVIDLSDIEDSSSGSHSKFAGSPEVVQLIGSGLNATGGLDAGNTPGLDQLLSRVPIRILGN